MRAQLIARVNSVTKLAVKTTYGSVLKFKNIKKMKFFIFIAFIALSSVAVMCDELAAEIKKYIEECNKEHNVSAKDSRDFMDGKLTTIPENLKCSSLCFLVKLGFMDEEGIFKPEAVKAKFDNKAAVDDCKDITGASACDTASKISQCLLSHK